MLLASVACASAFLALVPLNAFGGQIPVVDGVIGGVGSIPEFTPISQKPLSVSAAPAGSLRVTENSGICETTEGVYSASGYGDLDSDSHMWFWFFEARNDPDTAPFAVWFNGGPGSSSMIGLFQEHGPCFIRNDSSGVDLNPSSWNEAANILYIDQPVGVGFSYGAATVGSSYDAAVAVWKFLQIFFTDSRFSKYATREFALWAESYGGHYGPAFAAYILDQNDAISAGTIQGLPINLQVLGIGNGMTDPLTQYPGYISYAAFNPYHPLVPQSTITGVNDSFYSPGGCRDQIIACNKNLGDVTCSRAQYECNSKILAALPGNYDVYYVLSTDPDDYPPDFSNYINSPAVTSAIGAEVYWTQSSNQIYTNFATTGDWMKSTKPLLEKVIEAGVRTVLFDGDVDYICNYMGVEAMVDSLNTTLSAEYLSQPWTVWTVEGVVAGQYKNADTLSYVRILGAGHEVPAYTVGDLPRGLHALTMFAQANAGLPIFST